MLWAAVVRKTKLRSGEIGVGYKGAFTVLADGTFTYFARADLHMQVQRPAGGADPRPTKTRDFAADRIALDK